MAPGNAAPAPHLERLTVFFGVYTMLVVGWIATQTGSQHARTVVSDLAHLPVEAAAAALAWRAGQRSTNPSTRRAWRFVSLALASWLAGDLLWAYYEVLRGESPSPSLADVPYLVFYPCLAVALLSFPDGPRSRSERNELALDVAAVLVGATMVGWYLLVAPFVRLEQGETLSLILSVAYPIGDLVLLFGVVAILLHPRRRDLVPRLLLVAMAAVVISDMIWVRLAIGDTESEDAAHAAWLIAEYLFLLAAATQLRQPRSPTPRRDSAPERISLLPYAAIAVGQVLLLAVGWQAAPYPLNGLLVGGVALTLVVVIRQMSVLRENIRLAHHQSRLAAIVEFSDDSIITSTLDGEILDWNPGAERLYGYRAGEVVGRTLNFFCPPERAAELRQALDRVAQGEVHRYDTVRVRRDGSPLDVSIVLSPIRDRSGEVVGVSGIARDITERKQLEALRDEFIGNAAHELRTPLATLTALGEILATHLDEMTPEQVSRALDALDRQGQRASMLVANLLDLSQLQGGRAPLVIEPVNVSTAIRTTLEAAPPPAATRVEISAPPGLEVTADVIRLEQVLGNLLINAYRYGGDRVAIRAGRRGAAVEVSVSDDGPGVPAPLVGRLFEPFTRGPAAESHGGSGIGLALCRQLVSALEGDIRYEAVDPHGARFTVRLPCA